LSYHLEKVFEVDIPALHHGNDGLIYTRVSAPYTPGTDRSMCVRSPTRPSITLLIACVVRPFRLKWKPPSENSIDFKLLLKFLPSATNPSQPDFFAKPVFALYAWLGGEGPRANYEPYDVMHVTDEEWEQYVCLITLSLSLMCLGLTDCRCHCL
jgi:mRNA guanylyltransferase